MNGAKINSALVTGVGGFIGSHLTKTLLENDIKVIGVDNLNSYYNPKLKQVRIDKLSKYDMFSFFKIDISEYHEIERVFNTNSIDIIVNLAAQAGVRNSPNLNNSYILSNINGFFNVLDLASKYGIQNIVYASSSSVYGSIITTPYSESLHLKTPKSLYALTKKMNEDMANFFSQKFSFNISGLRFFTVYGNMGRPDMAYYLFADKLKNNEEIVLFNQGKMSRDMTHVNDIVNGILLSMKYTFNNDKQGFHEVFNLGNDRPISTLELLSKIEDFYEKKALLRHEVSDIEVVQTHADLSKSKEILGYQPSISFEEGMSDFLNWHNAFGTI